MKLSFLSLVTVVACLSNVDVAAATHNKHHNHHHHKSVSHSKHHKTVVKIKRHRHNIRQYKDTTTWGVGVASWYGYESCRRYKNRLPKTASGDVFYPSQLTAAHRSLPFGTKVKVTNLATSKSVIVTINDRGPFVHNRIIDLSKSAAKAVGIAGLQRVSISVIG